jgi:plastocyanin
VTHGTATGTRLRPEDAVGTEAAFEGQQAMYQRRKLIDDLLATGVPEVTAAETGPRGGLLLALLYIAIPLVAIFILAAQDDGSSEEPAGAPGGGAPSVDVTLVAEAVAWDTDEITFPAGDATVAIDNRDSVEHNFATYENEQDADDQSNALVETPNVAGGESAEFPVAIDQPGEYVFQCDIHPAMRGTATVEEEGAGGNQ